MAQDKLKANADYNRKRYVWRQVSDVVGGSVTVKQAGEVYLPMPSGMRSVPNDAGGISKPASNAASNVADYSSEYLPWYNPNPAYRAYLQRARFPDMTANTLRGLVGIATRVNPEVKLPKNLEYLLEVATPCGKSLFELFSHCVSEVIQKGKITLVLDVTEDNIINIVPYLALANINWKYALINGKKRQSIATFVEDIDSEDEEEVHLHYYLDMEDEGKVVATAQKFVDGVEFGPPTPLVYMGKTLEVLPVVNIGSVTNNAEPDLVPLLGLSDIALQIYREDADASQARYLTCNPTLFITGVDQTDAPRVIGSTVVIGISNPAAKAYYTNTDTSALEHMRSNRQDLFAEAVAYGAHFLGAQQQPESGEALKVRQSSNGATLIHIVNQVGKGILDALKLAAEWTGGSSNGVEFEPSIEFSEVVLSAQDITALVTAWVQGGISQDTLLDNLRYAGIIDPDKTNDQEKSDIETSRPVIPMPSGAPNDKAAG